MDEGIHHAVHVPQQPGNGVALAAGLLGHGGLIKTLQGRIDHAPVPLQRDYAAVKAALTLPWSNGPVEGHINRLKLIKRSGYGRMQLALLRQRVLYEAA